MDDERILWEHSDPEGRRVVTCMMRTCCAGAELQVRVGDRGSERIAVREMYPSKSDLYERARELERDYEA